MKFFELEDLGITTIERFEANPEYWIQKSINAKKSIENVDTASVSGEDGSSNIHYVHQSNDLALKRTLILTFPCWEGANCPIVNWGWNAGSTTQIWFVTTDGQVSFRSSVCLDSPSHHDEVNLNIRVERDIHSIFQTELYSFDRNWDRTFAYDGTKCFDSVKNKDINGGSRAGMTTSISDISFD